MFLDCDGSVWQLAVSWQGSIVASLFADCWVGTIVTFLFFISRGFTISMYVPVPMKRTVHQKSDVLSISTEAIPGDTHELDTA